MTSLRDLTELDIAQLVSINNEGYPAVPLSTVEEMETLFKKCLYRRGAVDDGMNLVGFVLALGPGVDYSSENYAFFEARFDHHFYIDRVVLSDEARGLGVGTLLYDDLFAFAKAHSYDTVTCEVNLEPPNPGSLRFHRRFGFVDIDQQATKGGSVVVQLLQAPVV